MNGILFIFLVTDHNSITDENEQYFELYQVNKYIFFLELLPYLLDLLR